MRLLYRSCPAQLSVALSLLFQKLGGILCLKRLFPVFVRKNDSRNAFGTVKEIADDAGRGAGMQEQGRVL
jgi:hypothetical protein